MEVIDNFLAFLSAAYNKQPDQLSRLERQTLAVLAVAATNRFAPSLSQGAVINAVTQRGALYLARHPFATVAAFWFGAWRNSTTRPQWAGAWTREVETAIAFPVFVAGRPILRGIGLFGQAVLRPSLGRAFTGVAAIASRAVLPTIPPQVFVNRATATPVRYIAKHPAAALSAYFAGQYIDSAFRPQFFGTYTQEVISVGLLPVFAHFPGVIPPLLRGAGATVNFGARAAASGIERTLGVFAPPPSSPRGGFITTQAARPLAGFSLGLIAEYFQQRERAQALSQGRPEAFWATYPGTGLAAAGLATGLSYIPPLAIRSVASSIAFNPASAALATVGRGMISQLLRPVPYFLGVGRRFATIPWPFGRTVWPGSGLVVTVLVNEILAATTNLNGYERAAIALPVGQLTWIPALPGYFYAITGRNFSDAVRASPLGRIGGLLAGLSQTTLAALRVPNIGQIARSSGVALRSIGRLSSTPVSLGSFGSGAALRAGLLRTTSGLGLAVSIADYRLGMLESQLNTTEILERIYSLQEQLGNLEQSGFTFSRSVYEINSAVNERLRNLPSRNGIPYLLGLYDFLLSTERNATPPQVPPWMFAAAYRFGQLLEIASDAEAQIRQPRLNIPQAAFQAGQVFGDVIASAWRTQPRDARGRFVRPSFGFNTGQPLPGVGFAEAMAYIERLAAASALKKQQSATVGVEVAPAIPSGVSAAYIPGKGREFWLYRGRDRNLLLQTLRDMLEIGSRDDLLESGKKTTQISNSESVFPSSVPGLQGAIIVLVRALKYDISLVRSRGTQGGYYPLSDEELYQYLYSMWPNLAPFGADE